MKFILVMLFCFLSVSELTAQDISGVYKTEWVKITFLQKGSSFTVRYPLNNGRIEGTLEGRVLTGRWYQSNGSGRIRFEFNSDSSAFTGKWSRGDAEPLSAWNGTRVQP